LLGTRLAARIGLPVPATSVVEVGAELIAHTEDLVIQLGRGRAPCKPGLQLGSRYPALRRKSWFTIFSRTSNSAKLWNLTDFCGMLVFDKWTCNTNGRQAIFYRAQGEPHYQARMIDQGFCFNACEWNFPDAPLRGLYSRHRVYESVRGIESFEPWRGRVESKITEAALDDIQKGIPAEWYGFDFEALEKMLQHLLRRRKLVRELLISAWKSSMQPFPNWK
jgi:hypothetical protein